MNWSLYVEYSSNEKGTTISLKKSVGCTMNRITTNNPAKSWDYAKMTTYS